MFIPPSCIDTLYDYIALLDRNYLCKIPESKLGTKIAVVGSGAAGMIAAHELLKMGLKPVIYEATGRMGGRLYSKSFEKIQESVKPFGELGAMRIPLSSRIFFHYARQLGLSYNINFPRAGCVKTAIYYKNQTYLWNENSAIPQPFAEIKLLWKEFSKPLVEKLHQAWALNDLDEVRKLWQNIIDQYKYISFYQALREQSLIKNEEQINIFGTIGIGYGGFNPLYQISFLELLRVLANDYMADNVLITEGASEFINRLYRLKVETPLGKKSLEDINALNMELPVVQMDFNPKTNNPIIITKKNNNLSRSEYSAVIFTGSMNAAHLINLPNRTESGVYLLSASVREAIKNSPMLAYSKTFICTEDKFWHKKNFPACILSDDVTRTTYFIDNPMTKYGIVCLSYAFGMDAMKLHAVDPIDRVTIFKRSLKAVLPGIEKYIVPLNNEVVNVDWINEKYINGAFKIATPGHDEKQKHLYYQFQSVLTEEDKGLYLAGDSVSWCGGWVEGALYTGLNSIFAVAKRLGASICENSPLSQSPNLYQY